MKLNYLYFGNALKFLTIDIQLVKILLLLLESDLAEI